MRLVISVLVVIAAMFGSAVPASADPVEDPCQLAVTFLCRFFPIAPGLDHDVDLSGDPAANNGPLAPEPPVGVPVQ
ncbi:MAG: hypothetical protein QOJ80_5071 [Mycobacterium sp.]|jgi:hypothetical protein|nr:hypothetical protein [Mycobacterium sp.]